MLQRLLHDGGGEGVIHHHQRAGIMGNIGNRADIAQVQPRIGGRFEEESLGVRAARLGPGVHIAGIDRCGFDAEARQDRIDQHPARAKQRAARHKMIARAERGKQHAAHRRHAGGRGAGGFGPFDQGDALFQHLHRGVLQAAVSHARALTAEARGGFFGIVIAIA